MREGGDMKLAQTQNATAPNFGQPGVVDEATSPRLSMNHGTRGAKILAVDRVVAKRSSRRRRKSFGRERARRHR